MAGNEMTNAQLAGKVAEELLSEMETLNLSVDKYLMKALRVARLLKDADAQTWLKYELSGYPEKFHFSSLGQYEKYAREGGRISADNKYWPNSLPKIEAQMVADKLTLDNSNGLSVSPAPVKNYVEAGATKDVLNSQMIAMNSVKINYVSNSGLYSAIKSSIHSYISDVYIGIQLGDVVADFFDTAKGEVDTFLGVYCPKATEKLVAITERLKEDNDEARSAALTSCRRLLLDVADVVFPAQDEPYTDSKGKKRAVGVDNYKNRILAFFDKAGQTVSNETILDSEVDHISARLDAIYEKSCKGVHADVTRSEANLSVISTYLIVAEVARAYKPTATGESS